MADFLLEPEFLDLPPAGPRDWRLGEPDDPHIAAGVVSSVLATWAEAWAL